MNPSFEMKHKVGTLFTGDQYYLDTHNNHHELLLFVRGNSKFNMEGNIYNLHPYDLLYIPSGKFHEIVHLSGSLFERYIINIPLDFFIENNCLQLSEIFTSRSPVKNNIIYAENVLKYGIGDMVKKCHDYNEEGAYVVAKGILYELLHTANKARLEQLVLPSTSASEFTPRHVGELTDYINNHLSEDLSLETLSAKFFISPSYINALFKRHLKITPKKYITHKRLLFARELYRQGKSLLDASTEAGFPSYSAFYRMYVNEFRDSPRSSFSSSAVSKKQKNTD